jgi:hypothetical protein
MLSSTARLSFKLERLNETLGYHSQMFEIILGLDTIGKPDWLITWDSTILYHLTSPLDRLTTWFFYTGLLVFHL